MSISKTASKNHEKLLPNHKSTLKVTDPELIEVFDNFACDEVLSHGNLDDRIRLMVILATLIANQTLSEFKVMLGGAEPWRNACGGKRDCVSGRAVLRNRQGIRLSACHQ